MRTSIQVAVFLVGFALFSVTVKRELRSLPSGQTVLRVRQEAPAFTLPDTQGQPVELRAVASRNKVVLVNFWATWCGPCRIELPQFAKLYKEKRGRGLEILAVNEDREDGKLTEYLKEKPLSFPVLVDKDGEVAKQYGVEAFPTSVLIDGNGRVLMVVDGVSPYLEYMVEPHLREAPGHG